MYCGFIFGRIFNVYPISRPFLIKAGVKHLRHDSYNKTLHFLITLLF